MALTIRPSWRGRNFDVMDKLVELVEVQRTRVHDAFEKEQRSLADTGKPLPGLDLLIRDYGIFYFRSIG